MQFLTEKSQLLQQRLAFITSEPLSSTHKIVDTATLTVSPEESGRVLGINDLVQAITGSVGVAVFGQMMSAGVMSGGSITGVGTGAAATYSNVFLVGGVIVLSALVIFILTSG